MAVTDIDQGFYNDMKAQRDAGTLPPDKQQSFDNLDRSGAFDSFKTNEDPSGVRSLTSAVANAPVRPPGQSPIQPDNAFPEFQPIPPDKAPPPISLDQVKPTDFPDEKPRGFWQALGDDIMLDPVDPKSPYSQMGDTFEGLNHRIQATQERAYREGGGMRSLGRGLGTGAAMAYGVPAAGLESMTGNRLVPPAIGVGTALTVPAAVLASRGYRAALRLLGR